jgi:hypothetical protein
MQGMLYSAIIAILGGMVRDELPHSRVGQWKKLKLGMLFIPHSFDPSMITVPLTVHLHGAYGTVEREWLASQPQGVLAVVTLPGLSSVYTKAFADPAVFDHLIADITATMKSAQPKATMIKPITFSSFSAGFGGVRELLRQPRSYARIDRLLLADTLYAGYQLGTRTVEPKHVADFSRFALEATRGRKVLLITHCDLQPPNYASTKETADALLKELQAERTPFSQAWPHADWKPKEQFRLNQCEILSFPGTDGESPLRHFRSMGTLYRRLDELSAKN